MSELQKAFLKLGTYRLARADHQYGMPQPYKCSECKQVNTQEVPLLEVTRTSITVYMSCPNCGCATSLISGPVQRILCEPSNDPENI